MSEYPPGIPPLRLNFPGRNRIISGLVRAVVIMQAPERSGALITAQYALEQGRDLMVHRCGLAGTMGKGCRDLADSGARIIDGRDDVFYELGWTPFTTSIREFEGDDLGGGSKEAIFKQIELEIAGKLKSNNGILYWRD